MDTQTCQSFGIPSIGLDETRSATTCWRGKLNEKPVEQKPNGRISKERVVCLEQSVAGNNFLAKRPRPGPESRLSSFKSSVRNP
jgi:hypothetical protein